MNTQQIVRVSIYTGERKTFFLKTVLGGGGVEKIFFETQHAEAKLEIDTLKIKII
jgi:hypothetical protein